MSHIFEINPDKPEVCLHCGTRESYHGECEVCTNHDNLVTFMTIKMCHECYDKEKVAQENLKNPDNQARRVFEMNETLQRSKEVDAAVRTRNDLFNAHTVSIAELKAAIDADDTIENKPYKLAEFLTERFHQYKEVIFNANEKIVDATNAQRAIQVYLNTLAGQIRAEERETLKLQDINYKPLSIKEPKVKSIKTQSNKKFDKSEIKKWALEVGVAETTLQTVAVARNLSPEKAADWIRRSINESKSIG